MKSIDQGIKNSSDSRTWAWYGADAPASNDIISIAEVAEQNAEGPEILYDNTIEKGDFSHKVARICELLNKLHEKPEALRSWEKLDGFSNFLLTLIDRAPTDIRGYALILQRFGSFIFSDNDSSKEKKNKINAVFCTEEETSIYSHIRDRAKLLNAIWYPHEGSLLDHIIRDPAKVAQAILNRLSFSKGGQFRIISHPFRHVRSKDLQGLAEAKTVAYQRGSDIHLISEVFQTLDKWDEDSLVGGVEQATLLDALLLHEMTELLLRENEPDICPLDAHIIASTFERYLKGPFLTLAVDDFFIDWPKPLGIEVAELQRREMSQQIFWWENAFGPPSSSIDIGSNIDEASFRQAISTCESNDSPIQRGEKIYRSKDGKLYRLDGVKKVFVRKKKSE